MRSINILSIQRMSADDRAKIAASDPAIRLIDAGGWFDGEIREIGIGGHLAVPPLPHHRAYGSVPRRFDRVKLEQRVGADRVSGSSGCAALVGPPGVQTCARTPSVNRRRPLH